LAVQLRTLNPLSTLDVRRRIVTAQLGEGRKSQAATVAVAARSADLAQLLANYGTTSGATYEDGDIDADGDVDLADLAALLAHYGEPCP